MSELARDSAGKVRELQGYEPLLRPSGAGPDCAYCHDKKHCITAAGRQFFVGELYPPCKNYVDHREKLDEDQKRRERLRELGKIAIPVPRPEGASKDCLHCKLLKESALRCYTGPWQGAGRVCNDYNEVEARPKEEQQRCFYCLNNFNCSQSRVLRNGKPCERYKEVLCG